MTIIHTSTDLPYLPIPNVVEFHSSNTIPPVELTRTAFLIPVFDDGSVLMAYHSRRGIEIPGGHLEDGESLAMAALREAQEETGAIISSFKPLGFLKMVTSGTKPEDYKYPFPISYQQFFVGRCEGTTVPESYLECNEPVRLGADKFDRLNPQTRTIVEFAVKSMLDNGI